MLQHKKNSYRELDNEKKFLRLKNCPSPPPLNLSNGPSLVNKTRTIIFGIQLVNLITVCSDGRDIVECADKGMKVFDTGQFDFS